LSHITLPFCLNLSLLLRLLSLTKVEDKALFSLTNLLPQLTQASLPKTQCAQRLASLKAETSPSLTGSGTPI
tara:strand:- start:218 stop:433 length:216 start_codon:yes stop_codon:yes gene_type:complete